MIGPLQRLVDRLPPRARALFDLLVATAKDSGDDRIVGLASEVAFWVLLSLPPLLLAAVSAAGLLVPVVGDDVEGQLIARIEELAGSIFTAETVDTTISATLEPLLTEGSPSLLSVSFVVAVFSASRVLRIVVHAITIAYDLEDARPSWMSRILGLVFTIVGLILGVVLVPLVVAGPQLGDIIENWLGFEVLLGDIWRIAYWPLTFAVATAIIAGLYHWATPWQTPFHRELPGAVLATVLALLISVGLRTYTQMAFGGQSLYAPLAAPLAILVWVWLEAIALLVGAELNAEIEKAYPAGEPPPEHPTLAVLGRRALNGVRNLRPGTSSGESPSAQSGRANESS